MKITNFTRNNRTSDLTCDLNGDTLVVSTYGENFNLTVGTYEKGVFFWSSSQKIWCFSESWFRLSPIVKKIPPFWTDNHWKIIDNCLDFMTNSTEISEN